MKKYICRHCPRVQFVGEVDNARIEIKCQKCKLMNLFVFSNGVLLDPPQRIYGVTSVQIRTNVL